MRRPGLGTGVVGPLRPIDRRERLAQSASRCWVSGGGECRCCRHRDDERAELRVSPPPFVSAGRATWGLLCGSTRACWARQ